MAKLSRITSWQLCFEESAEYRSPLKVITRRMLLSVSEGGSWLQEVCWLLLTSLMSGVVFIQIPKVIVECKCVNVNITLSTPLRAFMG